MPKNKGKGGKNYKKGKKRDEGETRRDLLFKEDGQGEWAVNQARAIMAKRLAPVL